MTKKLWKQTNNEKIQCLLCSHFCELGVEDSTNTGKCRVRKNKNGFLINLVENKIVSHNVDPIEKKPLYHFLPNSAVFSIGSMGCNFDCAWCQNSSIAHPKNQEQAEQGAIIDASMIIDAAIKNQCKSIAFTYNEPTIFFDLMLECAMEAKKANIRTVLVSNGYQSKYSLELLLPYIDAANIDLKCFSEETYQNYCKAHLKPVLHNIKEFAKNNIWLEITTLLIPTINDNKAELKDLANFIAQEVGTHIPWHISAFHPSRNMMHIPRTNIDALKMAYDIGKDAGLEYVYIGNVQEENNTHCPKCKKILIKRTGYNTEINAEFTGQCPYCKMSIVEVWE